MSMTKLDRELHDADFIYIISADGYPLMPTRRRGHVKRLLNHGKARIVLHVPFTVQLKYKSPEKTQPVYAGIDPGRTNIGVSAVTEDGECIYRAHVSSRNRDVPKKMKKRRECRGASRRGERQRRKRRAKRNGTVTSFPNGRMLPGYEKPVMVKDIINETVRFIYRKRPDGWLTSTARQLVQTHESIVRLVSSILPVTEWTLEVNKFSFMQMDSGRCYGADFRNGRMKGYEGSHEYVYARQGGVCPFCGKPIEHYHHMIPRSMGGSDLPENLIGLCRDCHEEIHLGRLSTKTEGIMKKYGALSVLNQAIPFIVRRLADKYGEEHVHFCTGKDTHAMRTAMHMPKDHDTDVVCIACTGMNVIPSASLPKKFEVMQFRRHDRALIKSQRERTYMLDGETVCKNRHRRFEQKCDSLDEFRKEHPKLVSELNVSKSVRYYNNPDRLMPGAVFLFGGERHVLQSQLTGGKYYRAVGCGKKSFPSAKCTVIRCNSGLVYI